MSHENEDEPEYASAALSARELEWAKNSPEALQEHKKRNGKIIRTRFPPEPNGYLHIGHAKSMNMNFRLAFEKLKVPQEYRRCIFRYDDTNPDAESAEYIDSLQRDVHWLGWTPERTTYSSDNFDILHDLAIQLIKKNLAYVCDMTKEEMAAQRDLALARVNARANGKDPNVEAPIPSPDLLPGRNRNTDVNRNLQLFEQMKLGYFEEGTYTLRLKMDFDSPNPNLYDLVAYRIKYTQHPHAGSGWCIYPSYDFTHGICDSLEDIDYSICTLEFEARRECYYWILWALDMFKPNVYEMSRLNVEYTVLSKRRLIKLVHAKHVRGWDDPRMPTVSGLRRRGYTANIINQFCMDVGATRAANVVEMSKLYQTARLILAPTCVRFMAALDPILIRITNLETKVTMQVEDFKDEPEKGTHSITLTSQIYIDASDFRKVDSKDYYGLAPNKAVGIKYHGGNLVCNKVIENKDGKVVELECTLDNSENRPKPKQFISWVPENSVKAEVRLYDHLFTVPEPTDLWEDELNPESEVVYENALIDPSITAFLSGKTIDKWHSNPAFQIERFGYFVVDHETTFDASTGQGNLVVNRTVSLKDAKKKLSTKETKAVDARKERDKELARKKELRMKIDPVNFFREAEEFVGKYSQYDDEGIPTHDAAGEALTKSALKKLVKEKQKFMKQLAKWKPS